MRLTELDAPIKIDADPEQLAYTCRVVEQSRFNTSRRRAWLFNHGIRKWWMMVEQGANSYYFVHLGDAMHAYLSWSDE